MYDGYAKYIYIYIYIWFKYVISSVFGYIWHIPSIYIQIPYKREIEI